MRFLIPIIWIIFVINVIVKAQQNGQNRPHQTQQRTEQQVQKNEPKANEYDSNRITDDNSWLAEQLRAEGKSSKQISAMLHNKRQHEQYCEADDLRSQHKENCDAETLKKIYRH